MKRHLESKARTLAIDARAKYGINAIEPIDIDKIFSLANVTCIKRPMKSNISGAFLKSQNAKVVIVNTSKTRGHQTFTLAHELFHAVFDQSLEGRVCKVGEFDSRNESEVLADFFASHFLMPEEGVRLYLSRRMGDDEVIKINDVIFLEHLYGISHQAMLTRLMHLNIIDKNTKDHFLPGIRQTARSFGYDDSLYLPTDDFHITSDYLEKAKILLDKDIITLSRYEELVAEVSEYHVISGEGVEDFVD